MPFPTFRSSALEAVPCPTSWSAILLFPLLHATRFFVGLPDARTWAAVIPVFHRGNSRGSLALYPSRLHNGDPLNSFSIVKCVASMGAPSNSACSIDLGKKDKSNSVADYASLSRSLIAEFHAWQPD
jgi:hypothetical protein